VNMHGCDVGRNTEMLQTLSEAFGGNDTEAPTVYAPVHFQVYGHEGRTPVESLADHWSIVIPTALASDQTELVRRLTASHGATPPGGGTWAELLRHRIAFEQPWSDVGDWSGVALPPRPAALEDPRDRTLPQHRQFLTARGRSTADWQAMRVRSYDVTSSGDHETTRILYAFELRDGRPGTLAMEHSNPIVPARTIDVMHSRMGTAADDYTWTPAAIPRPGGPPGRAWTIHVDFRGSQQLVHVPRILTDGAGHAIHPPRSDATHYGHYTPPRPQPPQPQSPQPQSPQPQSPQPQSPQPPTGGDAGHP
jgi:hypothetical protein